MPLAALSGLLSAVLFCFAVQREGLAEAPAPPFVGTIESISGNEIRLKTGRETIKIYADGKTEISKGKTSRDLSVLKPGNEVSVRCDSSSGRLVAATIWAKAVAFSGVVVRVNPADLLITADGLGNRTVRFYPTTASFASLSELTEGQQVYVAGVDTGDATVDAVRIAIYDTDAPVTN